jgi:surface antigen
VKRETAAFGLYLVICIGSASGCVTPVSAFKPRTEEQESKLKLILHKKTPSTCQYISGGALELAGSLKKLDFYEDSGKNSLVYESVFKTGVRSVFQPLKENYSSEGDGYYLGQPAFSDVNDFVLAQDQKNQVWTSYRFRTKSSQLYRGVVEYLDPTSMVGKSKSFALPVPKNLSIQKLWLLPVPKKGGLQVLARSNSAAEKYGASALTTYLLFSLNTNNGYLRKLFESKASVDTTLSHMHFFQLSDNLEPVALGVKTYTPADGAESERNTASEDKKSPPKTVSEVVLRRVFGKNTADIPLISSSHLIAQFQATHYSSKPGGILMSWTSYDSATGKNHAQLYRGFLNLTEEGVEAIRVGGPSTVQELSKTAEFYSIALESAPIFFKVGAQNVNSPLAQGKVTMTWTYTNESDFATHYSSLNFGNQGVQQVGSGAVIGPEAGMIPLAIDFGFQKSKWAIALTPADSVKRFQKTKSDVEMCVVPNPLG